MKNTQTTWLRQPDNPIQEGNVRFTPATANMVISRHSYEKNRDVSKADKHVEVLAETMRRGLWLPKDQISFAELNGNLVLVNGHHRMHAQVRAAVDIEWNIAIYPCDAEADLGALYARFDTNVRKRTDENVLSAFGLADETGMSKTTARGLWRATPILANGLRVGRRNDNILTRHIADDRLSVAREYISEALNFEKAIAPAPTKIRRMLLNGSVMSVALATYKAHPGLADDFWGGLALNDGLRRGDPRATLLAWLPDAAFRGNASAPIFAAAKAWNYFCSGKRLTIIKMIGSPIVVNGTGYVVAP